MVGEESRFGREWRASLPALMKPYKKLSYGRCAVYSRRSTQVLGGFTSAQWLKTLTDESPTSSDLTPWAESVIPLDKACRNEWRTRRIDEILPG